MSADPQGIVERTVLDRPQAEKLDRLLSDMAAVQRYRIIRKYVAGLVVDAACGTGFGSWVLSKCPAVTRVIGLDRSLEAATHAGKEFPECAFMPADFTDQAFTRALRILAPDTVVSVETIEHLQCAPLFIEAVLGSGASRFVVTWPSFETVTFNPHHVRDWTLPEVNAMVGRQPTVAFVIDDTTQLAVYDLG